ncbi:MAG: hypothetical protein AAF318_01275 [Pseudomonadota bacterium]
MARRDPDDAPGLMPIADLLIGTTATLLLVVLALAPQLGTAPPTHDPPAVAVEGPVLLAAGGRLTGLGEAAGVDVGLDGIATLGLDPSRAPVLVIGAGGAEAAFLTEARLAALGVATVRRVRLPAQCSRIVAVSDQGLLCE